jgi:uroporphyrinogen decarboxylase
MEHLITPAKDHNKLLLMDTCGKVDQLLPIIYDIGFNGIHPIGSEFNDIFQVREQWAGKVALIGNVPIALLARGNGAGIENKVREYCETLAPGGGYVLGSSGRISEEIPPENMDAMGRWGKSQFADHPSDSPEPECGEEVAQHPLSPPSSRVDSVAG